MREKNQLDTVASVTFLSSCEHELNLSRNVNEFLIFEKEIFLVKNNDINFKCVQLNELHSFKLIIEIIPATKHIH